MSNAILKTSKFIHIPKCGGTAIGSTLWYIGCISSKDQVFDTPHNGHLFASQMPEDGKPCFTFVRNPISWWQSFYYWNMNKPLTRFSISELKTKSFDEWIDDYGQFWLGLYSKILFRYLGEDEMFPTKNRTTHIGKIESLYTDLGNILDDLGEKYDKNRLDNIKNGTFVHLEKNINIQSYDKNISKNSKDIIYKTEKPIFDRFNYDTSTSKR